MKPMVVQAGTCLLLLSVLLTCEVLIARNLHDRWRDLSDNIAQVRAQFPHGVPELSELGRRVDGLDRELGSHLYPKLHDLTQHLAVTLSSQQQNAQRIRVLEGQLAISDAQEGAPPATFLGSPLAWLHELLDQIITLRTELGACRTADGQFNQELVRVGISVQSVQRAIDEDLHQRDLANGLLLDSTAYASVRRAYLGAGRTALVLEHLILALLLAMLTLRYLFRLLILLEIPGEVRLG